MGEAKRTSLGAKGTLTEYERANARVSFFQAIERDGKKVIESLLDSSPEEWAARWFMGRNWAVRQAKATQSIWADFPEAKARLEFQRFPKGLMTGIRHRRFENFEYRSWNPLKENRSEAKARLMEQFKSHLKAEFDEYSDEVGYEPRRRRVNEERDASWLVLYQFGEKTCGEISQAENRGESQRNVTANKVQMAIGSFARLIDLPLRRGNRPGRPVEIE